MTLVVISSDIDEVDHYSVTGLTPKSINLLRAVLACQHCFVVIFLGSDEIDHCAVMTLMPIAKAARCDFIGQ